MIVKVAEVAPEGIVTVAGAVAEMSALDSVTTAPPPGPEPGALPFRVTVPLEVFPPITLAGLTVKDEGTAGLTINPAFQVELL